MKKFIERYRQAPVFSTVYVIGSALSVASIMLVAIFLHVKTADIYPEHDRSELLYFNFGALTSDNYGQFSWSLAPWMADSLASATAPFATSAQIQYYYGNQAFAEGKVHEDLTIVRSNANLFKVYDYKFIHGRPFTDAEATTPVAVVSDKMARRLFSTDNAVGREFILDGVEENSDIFNGETRFRVVGVFNEGSRLLANSYAQIIFPAEYSEEPFGRITATNTLNPIGDHRVIMKANSAADMDKVRAAAHELERRFNSASDITYDNVKMQFTFGEWPRTTVQKEFMTYSDTLDKGIEETFALYGLIALMLLLVPALNLSSLMSGNMDSKMAELGVRKAFGARRGRLLRECLNENLWLTGCGALLGLLLSWWGVAAWKDWLFNVGGNSSVTTADVALDPAMLFAPSVFIVAVVVCVLLNTLSAIIPVWWSLRRPIVESINRKS